MEFFREIDSTNRVVKEALEQGCDQGFACTALKQTAGYGRQGRVWSSPLGGLYFSVALRPQADLERIPTLALLAALALRESIAELKLVDDPARLQIKWPNDVVIAQPEGGFRKLCGISSEMHAGGVCVGMGINVLRQAAVETDGRYLPAYLSDVAGPNMQTLVGCTCASVVRRQGACHVAQTVVDKLLEFLPLWEAGGFAPFAEKYNECSYLSGKPVAVANSIDAPQTEGVVCGIDPQGCLLIQTAQGEIEHVIAGEAHLV